MGKIIAITNQKGGVGKTTTAINLGASLAVDGFKILAVDLDPQSNLTSGIGLAHQDIKRNIYHGFTGEADINTLIHPTQTKGLDIIPSSRDLIGVEVEFLNMIARERVLKNLLEGLKADYRYILIDCPPSLGLLTINALSAAHSVLIPLQCEYFALEGLAQLLKVLKLVRDNINNELIIEGVLLTMFDMRTNISQQVAEEVMKHFRDRVFNTIVPRNVRLAESPSHGKPVYIYDPNCSGSRSYFSLADEILKNNGIRTIRRSRPNQEG